MNNLESIYFDTFEMNVFIKILREKENDPKTEDHQKYIINKLCNRISLSRRILESRKKRERCSKRNENTAECFDCSIHPLCGRFESNIEYYGPERFFKLLIHDVDNFEIIHHVEHCECFSSMKIEYRKNINSKKYQGKQLTVFTKWKDKEIILRSGICNFTIQGYDYTELCEYFGLFHEDVDDEMELIVFLKHKISELLVAADDPNCVEEQIHINSIRMFVHKHSEHCRKYNHYAPMWDGISLIDDDFTFILILVDTCHLLSV